MNKIIYFLLVIGLAIISSARAGCIDYGDCLQQCPQIVYMDSEKSKDSEKSCKDSWDFFEKAQENEILSMMTLKGLGGQKANAKKALNYAEKVIEKNQKRGEAFVKAINAVILDQRKEARTTYYSVLLSMDSDNDLGRWVNTFRNFNKVRSKYKKIALTLSPSEAEAVKETLICKMSGTSTRFKLYYFKNL